MKEYILISQEEEIIGREEGHKYLGVLEADEVKDNVMEERLGKEYIGRIRKIFKSKLNGMNTISAINSHADAVIG